MRRNEITTRKRTSNRIPGAKAALLLICLMAALAFQQVFQAHAQSTGIPTITGTAKAGAPLKADTSAISDPEGISDGAFTYQWVLSDQVADTDILGADGPHYIPWDGDIGKRLKVRVSYTDDANNQEGPLTSAASHTVARNPAGPVIWSGTVTAANLGNMRHGYSTVPGDLGGSISAATFTYRGSAFTIVRVRTADSNGDEGFNFDIETSNEGGNHLGWTIIASDAPAASRSTINAWRNGYLHFIKNNNDHHWTDGHKAAVALRINNPRTYGRPRITGDATIGQILTADPKGIIDRNGLPSPADNFTYQWMRWTGETLPDIPGAAQHYLDSRPIPHEVIPGATRKTYVPTADELGRTIKVRVSYTDGDGFREGPLTSTATPEVVNPTGAGSVTTPEMLPAPQMFSVEKTTQTAAVLRWSPHQDAEEYRLEKKKAGQEEWARIPYITAQPRRRTEPRAPERLRIKPGLQHHLRLPDHRQEEGIQRVRPNINSPGHHRNLPQAIHGHQPGAATVRKLRDPDLDPGNLGRGERVQDSPLNPGRGSNPGGKRAVHPGHLPGLLGRIPDPRRKARILDSGNTRERKTAPQDLLHLPGNVRSPSARSPNARSGEQRSHRQAHHHWNPQGERHPDGGHVANSRRRRDGRCRPKLPVGGGQRQRPG